MTWALGHSPDIAINHDAEALAMHAANHPGTLHLCANVLAVNPLYATGGQPVDVLHASPDCTHFSKAKGGKPRSQHIRDLAWVVVRWAEEVRPRLITLENVEEFQTWGPLDAHCQPIKAQAGATFRAWVRRLRRLGYRVDWRELRACDYGAPTTRKRLFVVARRDGRPVVWPEPTHGPKDSPAVLSGKLKPYRTAAECVDWTAPARSIFVRSKPLAEATQRRIAEGIRRYVLGAGEPFIVSANHTTRDGTYRCFRGQTIDAPLGTVTQSPGFAVATPVLMTNTTGHAPSGLGVPVPTVATGNHHFLTAPILSRQFGNSVGQTVEAPHPTITQSNHDMLVTASMVKMRGANIGAPVDEPLRTVSAQGQHHALTTATLIKYYGTGGGSDAGAPLHTVTAKDRMGLVCAELDADGARYAQTLDWLRWWGVIGPDAEAEIVIRGVVYRIVDIAMRMLAPRELYRAQGFPDTYVIAPECGGKPISKTAQVRMCGNSVPPQFVAALVTANGPGTWAEEAKPHLPLLAYLPPRRAGMEARV
nr:MAG TPA: DNA cytosine methyltransferase [Caudoviricetes sp.]